MQENNALSRCVAVLLVVGAAAYSGCTPQVCERSDRLDLGSKLGDCAVQADAKLLGEQCQSAISQCSSDDVSKLNAMYDCLDKLQTCTASGQEAWLMARQGCFEKVESISTPCAEALFEGTLPGVDAGPEDGGVDAGRQPISDGGNGVELVAVATENDFALAWSLRQDGTPEKWEINAENVAGVKYPEVLVSAPAFTFSESDAGDNTQKTFFVVGLAASGSVVSGSPFSADGGGGADAGMCSGPFQCSIDQVCDLGVCKTQACKNSNTCPSGYECLNQTRCQRTFGPDGGTMDAGSSTTSTGADPLPFISNPVTVTAGKPVFGEQRFISPFPARGPAMVAYDTARQFVAMEQENQLFGHYTANRGKSFQTSNIDTIGTRIRLAYEKSQSVLYACYNVGYGIRVRVSRDQGRTWQQGALTIEEPVPTDGGLQTRIRDCDIAAWRDGNALLVTVEGEEDRESMRVRTLSPTLDVLSNEVVFVSSEPNMGANVFGPSNPVLATLPEDFIVHVGFTASRTIPQGRDTEVYGLYRDSTTGSTFIPVGRINDNLLSSGNALPQDEVALIIEPKSKRAIAAFGTYEVAEGVGYNTVYLSLFDPQSKRWGTGSDLSVFYRHSTSKAYLVFCNGATPPVCERDIAEDWDAFSPQLAITPGGKVYLAVLAGPSTNLGEANYRPYIIPFDFQAPTPANPNTKGWFVPQAKRGGTSIAFNPSLKAAVGPRGISMAVDSQLSAYVVYVEGVGLNNGVENRPVMVPFP